MSLAGQRILARLVFHAYPCEHCGAKPREPCRTAKGRELPGVHITRTRLADRCPSCGSRLTIHEEPGDVCARCLLVRTLEIERSTIYRHHSED